MNSVFICNFTKLLTIKRTISTSQIRCANLPKRNQIRVTLRRIKKHIKKEAREHEKEIADSLLPPQRKIEYDLQSLATRGFLRSTKSYTPPANVHEKILDIAKITIGNTDQKNLTYCELTDPKTRFDFLSRCIAELEHDIPNSQLHKMKTVSSVIEYFQLPVSSRSTYDRLCDNQSKDLPPNLHLQREPIRFHPDTDTLFGGITAFPESSTIVSGLKTRKKFKGYDARPVASKLK